MVYFLHAFIQEIVDIHFHTFLDPFDELDQGLRPVPVEQSDTLGLLNSRTKGSNGNSLVKVVHLELFFVESVDELLERPALFLSDN